MKKLGNVLIVDDNAGIRSSLEILLPSYFETVIVLSTPNQIPSTLQQNPNLDAVLLDMNFKAGINSGNEGLYWLKEIKCQRPTLSVVLFTAYGDVPLAVEAIKVGAYDFIEKPWDNAKLILTLQNAVKNSRTSQKIKDLKAIKSSDSGMYWGESPSMKQLKAMVEKVAPTDANILIMGENGTGKEVLAKEIHNFSRRSDEQLVNVDMGAITENLFESELFGHAKGAFTDAKTERSGKFEIASGGTLFLDEIGNIPLYLQSKLLSVIQNRQVIRVGENTSRPIDIRLITATNADIEVMVKDGKFREDLYYRINTIVLYLPPLRERGDDIFEMAELFLARFARKYGKKCIGFTDSARFKMKGHNWSGNIRELLHTVEKAVILSDGDKIGADDLLLTKSATKTSSLPTDATLEEVEKSMVRAALDVSGENYTEVAQKLGITRQTLYNKIKKFGF